MITCISTGIRLSPLWAERRQPLPNGGARPRPGHCPVAMIRRWPKISTRRRGFSASPGTKRSHCTRRRHIAFTCVAFAPGQPYLGGVPEALVISRRPAPRPPHPPGAVLIGGGLCVVAPFAMPTGWYVIGRTPERLYAAERKDAFLIQAGDNLRFDPIDVATFRDLEQRATSGEIVARKSAA